MFLDKRQLPLERTTAMTTYLELRIAASGNGLRNVLVIKEKDKLLFTHLETDSGMRYQLLKPMTGLEMEFTARMNNCLAVLVPAEEGARAFSYDVLLTTARIIAYNNPGTNPHIGKWLPGKQAPEDGTHTGTWVQTQNTRYSLLSIKSEEVGAESKGPV